MNTAITQIEYRGDNGKVYDYGLPAELTGVYNAATGKFTISGTPATAGLITIYDHGSRWIVSWPILQVNETRCNHCIDFSCKTDQQELCMNKRLIRLNTTR
ncbi:hypothetical protein CS542_07875 [Pedobacter sp. IW39]|nr:hypothetical protein CS542_07875 [Pedobacter sp. IW39]